MSTTRTVIINGREVQQPINTVRWHKKGCKTCRPIVVPVRPSATMTPATN